MKQTLKYLSDEHMRLYEWNGLADGMSGPDPERSKRTHSWHASYAVLAVLTSLLILNGCDKQGAAEQASEQIGQAAQEPPAHDTSTAPADAAAPSTGGASEPAAAGTREPAGENPGQNDKPEQQP
jgi:hypothetical protein